MHEYSIALSIVEIAEKEVEKYGAKGVEKIELDIGQLSGIEVVALDFAWEPAVTGSVLETSQKTINIVEGEATCNDCHKRYRVKEIYDACPECGSYMKEITKGKELRIKSLTLIE
jgi:hydrogenase nickel incorporation protein HypA/HybF